VSRLGRSRIALVLRALGLPPAVPVVMAMLGGPHFPWITSGSAADLCVRDAAAKAAEEAAHAYQELSAWNGEIPSPRTLAPVAPVQQHMLLWATRQRSRLLIETLAADRPVRLPQLDRVRAAAVNRELLALCPHAVEVVLTPPDCRLCGMEVLKVVAPGLPTLSFGSVGAPARHLSAYGIRRARKLHPFG
jgi:YcaO-like family.